MPRSKAQKARLTKAEKNAWKAEKAKGNKAGKHPALVAFTKAPDADFPKAG